MIVIFYLLTGIHPAEQRIAMGITHIEVNQIQLKTCEFLKKMILRLKPMKNKLAIIRR